MVEMKSSNSKVDLLEKLISQYSYDLSRMHEITHSSHEGIFVLMFKNCRFVSSLSNPSLRLGFLSALEFTADTLPAPGEWGRFRDLSGDTPVAVAYDEALNTAIAAYALALKRYEDQDKARKR